MKYRIELTEEERSKMLHAFAWASNRADESTDAMTPQFFGKLYDLVRGAKIIDPPVWIQFEDGRRVQHFPDDLEAE